MWGSGDLVILITELFLSHFGIALVETLDNLVGNLQAWVDVASSRFEENHVVIVFLSIILEEVVNRVVKLLLALLHLVAAVLLQLAELGLSVLLHLLIFLNVGFISVLVAILVVLHFLVYAVLEVAKLIGIFFLSLVKLVLESGCHFLKIFS